MPSKHVVLLANPLLRLSHAPARHPLPHLQLQEPRRRKESPKQRPVGLSQHGLHPAAVCSARLEAQWARADTYSNLQKLHEYKYAGVDNSLVSKYILKPFYTNIAIKCFPMSMAPNAITLSGFSFVVINLLTLLYYNPSLDQDCPPWVYLSWSIGLFLYQTFDAVDGTQARRTHQSGPLGELFDHG